MLSQVLTIVYCLNAVIMKSQSSIEFKNTKHTESNLSNYLNKSRHNIYNPQRKCFKYMVYMSDSGYNEDN
jgi:hypothetical protein